LDSGVEELGDVSAWRLSPVSDLEDLVQFAEGQTNCLAGAYEPDPVHHTRVVVPIPGLGPLGFGEQAFVFVEADG
jgi:hypothetical protein